MAKKKSVSKRTRRSAKKTSRPAAGTKPPRTPAGKRERAVPSAADEASHVAELLDQLSGEEKRQLTDQRRAAQSALDSHFHEIMQHPAVTGVSVDLRRQRGVVSTPLQYTIRIDVSVKRSTDDPRLDEDYLLPSEIDGVPVDVVECNYRRTQGDLECTTFRPELLGGIAIAPENDPRNWGTLGMAVRDLLDRDQFLLLTNLHVALAEGNEIRQPPKGPDVPAHPDQIVGQVVRVSRQTNPLVDCAVILPNGTRPTKPGVLGPGGELPGSFQLGVLGPADEGNARVFHMGAGSGSEVIRPGIVTNTSKGVRFPDGTILQHQIVVESAFGERIIEPGDSGAVLLFPDDMDNPTVNSVVGLVIGEFNEGRGLVACHMTEVFRELDVTIQPR